MSSKEQRKEPALPPVRRARGRYVYASDGRRYLDCYLNDGTAILGHRPPRVSTLIKDVVSTGRYAEYPSEYSGRLEKELRTFFPSYPVVRLYQHRDAALAAVSDLLGPNRQPTDPARVTSESRNRADGTQADGSTSAVAYWRPFLSDPDGRVDVLLPVIPFPGMWAGQPVCARETVDLAPSGPLSAVCVAGQLRALQTLTTILSRQPGRDSSNAGPTRGSRSPRGGHAGEGVLLPDPAPRLRCFSSRGPYLTPSCRPESYSRLFYTFLENGIILHPSSAGVSIWSAEAGSKDVARFVDLDSACATRLSI